MCLFFGLQEYEHDEKLEQLKIYLNETVRRTTDSVLEIDFTGTLNNKIVGFYRSMYRDENDNGR